MIKFQISNFQFPISNKKFSRNEKGFTLIELLVVMIAFMLTGTVIASVIFTHVKAIDKTNTETTVRQVGNGIISQMAKDIRNAKSIDLVKDTIDQTVVNSKLCNSAIEYQYIKMTFYDNATSEYQCIAPYIRRTITTTNPISNQTSNLFESTIMKVPGVGGSLCSFTCTSGSLPVIAIRFTLDEAVNNIAGKSTSIGEKVSIPFTTSIQMRNVQ